MLVRLPPEARAQDAIAEIHYLASPNRNYEWVFEADITACFDEIDHTALMGRVRGRVGDKRVLSSVKAFLRAGVLTEEGLNRETITGTPQGGILSPLLANIALSVLDEHFADRWQALGPQWKRIKHRRAGGAVMRLVRYADDFVVLIAGHRADADALWDEVGAVLAPMDLRLSAGEVEGLPPRRRGSTSSAGASSAGTGRAGPARRQRFHRGIPPEGAAVDQEASDTPLADVLSRAAGTATRLPQPPVCAPAGRRQRRPRPGHRPRARAGRVGGRHRHPLLGERQLRHRPPTCGSARGRSGSCRPTRRGRRGSSGGPEQAGWRRCCSSTQKRWQW